MTHVVVLGAYGSAGVAAAETLADAAAIDRLTLVDDGDPGGGLCILRGCMPSKEVLSAAAHRYQARHDHRVHGVPEVDLQDVVDTKDEHVHSFAEHRRAAVHGMAERDGVEFVHETARFVDDHTVAVGDRELDADYVVLATGSSVNVPDIPGIDAVSYRTSADVLDATEFGDSGVVMGFGYVGVELVPYLSEAAGMDLTVIEHDARPLDRAPDAFGDELLDIYREEFGVDVLTNTREQAVEPTENGVRLTVEGGEGEEGTVTAEELFVFTGRRPTLDGLGLDRTELDPGTGWVTDTMQTRDDPRVFVPGDANGERMLLHMAKEEGYLAGENILADLQDDPLETYDPLHHAVMFAGAGVYPYASLGLTAEEARDAGYDPVVVRRRAEDDGVFKTKDAPRGLAELVVAADGTVLGYEGLHLHADVMAKTLQVVLENELTVAEVPDRAYHPTTPEIVDGLLRDAAEQL
jgi:pyruvate/2-oxoglutarate dehydrogenase complex dihydrolipoamide dehydrogenase (E3) component